MVGVLRGLRGENMEIIEEVHHRMDEDGKVQERIDKIRRHEGVRMPEGICR